MQDIFQFGGKPKVVAACELLAHLFRTTLNDCYIYYVAVCLFSTDQSYGGMCKYCSIFNPYSTF